MAEMETILLVDDEPDVCHLARDILEAKGYRILEAGGADEARRIAQSHAEPIHLLLTDVMMPGMSGHELAAQLRPERLDMKVLYMSGFALVRAQHEMLERGVGLEPGSPILPKPFSVEGLTQKVCEVLASRTPSRSAFARPPARGGSDSRPDPWWP
jgi:CheY-like chemotaxis protein